MSTIPGNSERTTILKNPVADILESPLQSSPRDIPSPPQKIDADWKMVFSEKMQQRGLKLQQKTVESIEFQRGIEEKIKKTYPPDEMSREWFNEDKLTVETRAYLLDKLMPCIVPGMEALLMEVEKKKVIEDDSVKFDPVNFLGEFLMRNNPEFSRDNQDLPYVRGLNEVLGDLKDEVFDIKFNRLRQLKEEMREIQNQRAQVGDIQDQVKQRRKEALTIQFQEWTLDISGRIPLALVQSALKSFLDVIPQYLIEDKPVYEKELVTVDTMEQKLCGEEFVEYVYTFIHHFSTDLFQEFLHHLAQCADMFRETIRHDIWRQMFSDLFLSCDHGKVGFLDRQRVLALMEIFYDNIISETEECPLRNPRQWPVIELGEMDPADFWADFQEGVQSTEGDSTATTFSVTTQKHLPAEEEPRGAISTDHPPDGSSETETEKEVSVEGSVLRPAKSLLQEQLRPCFDSVQLASLLHKILPHQSHFAVEDDGSTHPAKEEEDPSTESSGKENDLIQGKPWSGDLLTSDLALRYSSYGDRSQDEYRTTASKFSDLRPIISDINSRDPSRITSAFNDSVLTLPQFVQLMETFLGERSPFSTVENVTGFIKKEYVETEEERISLLAKVRHDAIVARQKLVLQALFEKWDNEGTGFLELEEVDAVLSKYKEGMETEAMVKGEERLSSSQSQRQTSKLSASEFCKYILGVLSELPGPEEEVYENMVEFLTTSVERSQAERIRGASRRKWLQQILTAAKTSGMSLDPVYKAVFQALFKDAEAHGNNKKISANIGLLEQSSPGKDWTEVLRYVACTSDDAKYVLNKTLHRDMKGVSFAAVYSGKPVHVPRVQYHGNIHFWNTDRPEEERKGSLIILPLMDNQQRVFGTLGIDTLREPRERNIFLAHEISFYQGVTNAFSAAFHHVDVQKGILQLVSSALSWIYSRAPNIGSINTYIMEPTSDMAQGYVLRNMMRIDNNTDVSTIYSSPASLRRRDNLFRDYLFKCADSSEVITTDAYGERHIAVPIRDPTGRALGVLDLSTGHCKELPAHEYQDLQKMLQMLQEACNEILDEQPCGETQKKPMLEAEQALGERKLGVLFHRFMLQDLRQCVSKLDHQSFAELKSYKEPPAMVHNILKAVLLLFCPEWEESEEIHSWNQCKLKVNSDLIRKILFFDPTAKSVQVQPEILAKYIKGFPRGEVWKHGSIPAEHLYNWAFTCLSLIELTQKMQDPHQASLVAIPIPNGNMSENITSM
ncbi:EF-hand calcium-binding domain-containing protein 5 [Discoglossus pictus]